MVDIEVAGVVGVDRGLKRIEPTLYPFHDIEERGLVETVVREVLEVNRGNVHESGGSASLIVEAHYFRGSSLARVLVPTHDPFTEDHEVDFMLAAEPSDRATTSQCLVVWVSRKDRDLHGCSVGVADVIRTSAWIWPSRKDGRVNSYRNPRCSR
jgi:hypothetical protein